ncbi:MAG TPA: hypothetical protein VKN36_05075 [Eudoraea sp.]|nr:hypothetical protein [Eudoraea sp.]
MKTSIILITALILNTSLLFAEPLSTLVQGISPWVLGVVEGLLLMVYFVNKWVSRLTREFMLDIGYLDVSVIKDHKK